LPNPSKRRVPGSRPIEMPATTDAPTIVTTTDAAPSPARGTSSPLAESTTTPFHERDHPAADHGVIALDGGCRINPSKTWCINWVAG